MRVLKHFNLHSSPPPTRRSRKENLIGQSSMWSCLEIVSWVNPICIGRISAVQFTWISSGSLIHMRTPFMNQQWQFSPEETMRLGQWARVNRSVNKPLEYHQKFFVHFSLWSHKWLPVKKATQTPANFSKAQRRPAKSSKASQCHGTIHYLLGYTYTLSKHHMSSQASTVVKHHMPFFQVASWKTPPVCSQQNILPQVCFRKENPVIRQFPENTSHDTTESPKKP